jgi:hypothetical protein
MPAPGRPRSLLLASVILGVPVLLTACSSGSNSASTTTAAAGSSSTTAGGSSSGSTAKTFSCALVPASDVNTALGTSVGAPQSASGGTATTCTYSSTNPIQTVIIRVDTASSAATFAAEKAQSAAHGEAPTAAAGIGDDAYSLTISGGGFTTNTFAVRKGTVEVQVNGPGTPAQTQAYATQLVSKV